MLCGALEVDQYGNINAHRGPGAFAGIGGFANITQRHQLLHSA